MVLRPGLRFVEPVLDLSYSNHAGQQGYPTRPRIRRGPAQRQRGGWGEVCDCYECHRGRERREAAVAERIAATEAMAREREVARIHAARQAQATRREVARREVARREALAREKYRAARAASQIQAQRAEQDRRAAGRRIDLSGSGPGLRRQRSYDRWGRTDRSAAQSPRRHVRADAAASVSNRRGSVTIEEVTVSSRLPPHRRLPDDYPLVLEEIDVATS